MGYRMLGDATMVVHFAFLGYVVAGGFLAWWWPVAIWPHLVAAGWGFASIVFHIECPLTYLEDWARRRGGEPGLTTGFIDHYLTGVVYPERYAGLVQLLAVGAVAVSWIGVLIRMRCRRAEPPASTGGSRWPRIGGSDDRKPGGSRRDTSERRPGAQQKANRAGRGSGDSPHWANQLPARTMILWPGP